MKRIATRANKINPKAHAIYNAYDCKCAICGWQATDEVISIKGRIQFSKGNAIHHIKASADGGSEDFTNLILLCPNHHKQADMGILPPEELTHYVKEVDTSPEARQALKDNAIMNVAAVIFG